MAEKFIKNAKGVKGCLIRTVDDRTGASCHMFRVYDYTKRKKNNSVPFVDYRIAHHDVFVTIDDDDAAFVEHDGVLYLDYDLSAFT